MLIKTLLILSISIFGLVGCTSQKKEIVEFKYNGEAVPIGKVEENAYNQRYIFVSNSQDKYILDTKSMGLIKIDRKYYDKYFSWVGDNEILLRSLRQSEIIQFDVLQFDDKGNTSYKEINMTFLPHNVTYGQLGFSPKMNFFTVNSDISFDVYDIRKREVVYNLVKGDFNYGYWSNTDRYLEFYTDNIKKNNYIYDLITQSAIEIPYKGVLSFSPDDSKAILTTWGVDEKAYLWDINNDTIGELGNSESYYWTKDSKYIYYIDYDISNNIVNKIIKRYDTQLKEWETIYTTTKSIKARDIRWVSENEFVITAFDHGTGIFNPMKQLLKPFDYYAIKVNIEKNTEKVKKLDAVLPLEYIWSYDNKYIYYLQQDGLYREKVNFDR